MRKPKYFTRTVVGIIVVAVAVSVYAVNSSVNTLSATAKEDTKIAAEYHLLFDTNDTQKDELRARGYSESEIAKIDQEDFQELERTWLISEDQAAIWKEINPELADVDIFAWTNADLQAYIATLNGQLQLERLPTSEQIAQLENRGIALDVAHQMLRDYIYISYDHLLAQSDDTLKLLSEKIIEAQQIAAESLQHKNAVKRAYQESLK